MTPNEELTYPILDKDEANFDEEWKVITQNNGGYLLSKEQAWGLRQEIGKGNRGIVMFQTFCISIPYIVEFYRIKRFLKDAMQLPATANEKPYVPIPKEKWEQIKKQAYEKIGR